VPACDAGASGRAGRTVRLYLFRGPGPDFAERDRDLLTLLRFVAAGHTNAQIARRPGLAEGTVRKHLENTYTRLNVSSRTAAVTRAFPDRALSMP
jgi:DNA-binding NarL/FixJ family response regulator